MSDSPASTGPGAPERLFSVSGFTRAGNGFRASMRTGAWNLTAAGRPTVGALGVLVDDVLALSVSDHSPSGASVSTEITIDLLAPVPADGRVLTCSGGPLEVGPRGAVARGEVVDEEGRRIAVALQRQRFVPSGAEFPTTTSDQPEPDAARILHGLPGELRAGEGGAAFDVPGSPYLANPAGAVHGGMSLYLSAVLGEAALDAPRDGLLVSSIRIAHLRPMPPDRVTAYTAEVLHAGRTLRLARITARGADDRVLTVATLTLQE